MRILLVDDSAAIRASIRRTLVRECDAEVSEAANGLLALEHLLGNPCDLVLLDLQMPGMDGIKTLQTIRRSPNRNALPVVMLTGTSDEMKVREAVRLGVEAFLLKPIQPETLVRRLAEVLARASRANVPSQGEPDLLTLRRHDRVLLIEPEPTFLAFATDQLSKYCHVDQATSSVPGLQACLDAPPAAIFLGGMDAFSANALFLAKVRNHPRLRSVPIYALVPPERMAIMETQLGFDGVLPRTLDGDEWTASAGRLVRAAAEGAKYLDTALEATQRYLASILPGEVVRRSEVAWSGLRQLLSARIDFEAANTPWSLTLVTTTMSARRIALAEAPDRQDFASDERGVSVVVGLARAAFEAIRSEEHLEPRAGAPHCLLNTCLSPRTPDDEVVGEELVLVLPKEVQVVVRLSERR